MCLLVAAAHASLTATQSGNWSDPATWGDSTPCSNCQDTIVIPAGITVTIPSGLAVTNSGSGTINNAGAVIIKGGGSLTNYSVTNNNGTIENAGSLANLNGGAFNNYGTVTNDAGGMVTNRNNSDLYDTVINNYAGATISNSGTFEVAGTVNNFAIFASLKAAAQPAATASQLPGSEPT